MNSIDSVVIRREISKRPRLVTAMFLVVLGLFLCAIPGRKPSIEATHQFEKALSEINYDKLDEAGIRMNMMSERYYRSKGWFTCDKNCQLNKKDFQEAQQEYNWQKKIEDNKIKEAKHALGIFSDYGIEETKSLFWHKFLQGKNFATRQSKWDMFWISLGAIGRDEKIANFLLRILVSVVFNSTIGLMGATIAFLFSLIPLILNYSSNIFEIVCFFVLASLAAISFAALWLFGIFATAGTTAYVGYRILQTTVRIQDQDRGGRRIRREY